jgi:hypothetical protein
MKGITGFIVAAVVLAIAGAGCLAAGTLERDMARAQQDIVTERYDQPQATFDAAERYFEYGSHLPWIGAAPLNDLRARKAALSYWQHQYDGVVSRDSDPVTAVPADNIGLQLVVANAVYRTGETRATDRPSLLQALDAGIAAYANVLKNAYRQ